MRYVQIADLILWIETLKFNQFQPNVAGSAAGKQPDVNTRSQSVPAYAPGMHWSKENRGDSDILVMTSTHDDK
jgi:hypothetical protein